MSVLAAAFVPSAPLLVPELASGAEADLEGLRAAAQAAVREAAAAGSSRTPVVVLGRGTATRSHGGEVGATLRPWGADVHVGGTSRTEALPLALVVGAWLLDRAEVALERRAYQAVAPGAALPPARHDDVVLVVVGDGSATRTPRAPGAFHPDAETYDSAAAHAIASGDPAELAALDSPLAAAVRADGATAWATAASWWGPDRAGSARLDADEAPYGVGYLVGVWTRQRGG